MRGIGRGVVQIQPDSSPSQVCTDRLTSDLEITVLVEAVPTLASQSGQYSAAPTCAFLMPIASVRSVSSLNPPMIMASDLVDLSADCW
jgi:hypothetical protein